VRGVCTVASPKFSGATDHALAVETVVRRPAGVCTCLVCRLVPLLSLHIGQAVASHTQCLELFPVFISLCYESPFLLCLLPLHWLLAISLRCAAAQARTCVRSVLCCHSITDAAGYEMCDGHTLRCDQFMDRHAICSCLWHCTAYQGLCTSFTCCACALTFRRCCCYQALSWHCETCAWPAPSRPPPRSSC
jgi:hypothetical protein